MKLLGIDFGTKRVGIAFSDDAGLMAFPHEVLANDDTLLPEIARLANEKEIAEIVIGHSLNREGVGNAVQTKIEDFINDLTLHIGLPVHLEPEQYTTQEAIRFTGRNDKTDAAAAAVILNSYIVRTSNKATGPTEHTFYD